MIGIVLDLVNCEHGGILYHRISDKPVIEYIFETCLKAAFCHRVIVIMSESDKVLGSGSTFKKPLFNTNLEISKKTLNFLYCNKNEEIVDRLYNAAHLYCLDVIVSIDPRCILLPTWFINDVIGFYLQSNNNCFLHTGESKYLSGDQNTQMYGNGFDVNIIPFRLLCEAYINKGKLPLEEYLYSSNNVTHFENLVGTDRYITKIDKDLKFHSFEQLSYMESSLREFNLGADISDILENI